MAFPKNGPISQPAANMAIALKPVTINGSSPKLSAKVPSKPWSMNTRKPAYVAATALMLDAATLIFRRVRRSARKSFHVKCWDRFGSEVAAGLIGASGAVDAWRATSVNGPGCVAGSGRAVRWSLVGRVEVGKGVVALHGGISAAGWRRMLKALAGRRVLVESMVVGWFCGVLGGAGGDGRGLADVVWCTIAPKVWWV